MKTSVNPSAKTTLRHFLETAPDLYMPGVSVDSVIFGFHDQSLKVLLLRFADTPFYVLPSGYIGKEEDLEDAALRTLQERTGLENLCLEQFYTSGNYNRLQENSVIEKLKQISGLSAPDTWLEQRFISVCYYTLLDDRNVVPRTDSLLTEAKWFSLHRLPSLIYDHRAIIKKALARLQSDLDEKLPAFGVLQGSFTMAQLQKLYEAVHQKKLVRTNFQRKMLGLGKLERLEKQFTGKSHKAPYLYRFRKEK